MLADRAGQSGTGHGRSPLRMISCFLCASGPKVIYLISIINGCWIRLAVAIFLIGNRYDQYQRGSQVQIRHWKKNYIYTSFVVEILKAQRREDKTAVGTTLPPLTTATMKVDSPIFDSRSKESSKMSPDIDVTRSPLTDVRVGETTVKDWTDAEERKVRRK